jgi:hypothetical protein
VGKRSSYRSTSRWSKINKVFVETEARRQKLVGWDSEDHWPTRLLEHNLIPFSHVRGMVLGDRQIIRVAKVFLARAFRVKAVAEDLT